MRSQNEHAHTKIDSRPKELGWRKSLPGHVARRGLQACNSPGPRQGKGNRVLATPAPRRLSTLDRVHVAMLFQRGGHARALRSLIAAELAAGSPFPALVNALCALYPPRSEDRRLVEGVAVVMAALARDA